MLLGPIASACSAVVLGAAFEWAIAQLHMFARFVAAGGELDDDGDGDGGALSKGSAATAKAEAAKPKPKPKPKKNLSAKERKALAAKGGAKAKKRANGGRRGNDLAGALNKTIATFAKEYRPLYNAPGGRVVRALSALFFFWYVLFVENRDGHHTYNRYDISCELAPPSP